VLSLESVCCDLRSSCNSAWYILMFYFLFLVFHQILAHSIKILKIPHIVSFFRFCLNTLSFQSVFFAKTYIRYWWYICAHRKIEEMEKCN
jgi:hypothetical protein